MENNASGAQFRKAQEYIRPGYIRFNLLFDWIYLFSLDHFLRIIGIILQLFKQTQALILEKIGPINNEYFFTKLFFAR